jgi:disease resistance protein RPM1
MIIIYQSNKNWIDVRQEASSFSESDRKQIEQFMDQIKEARSHCERYELLSQVPTSDPEVVFAESNETAGCGSLWKNTVLVGIDGAKSELLNHLKDQQKELKVVSILGAGGHGKTTLAKEICGDIYIKEQFECQAFVSIGLTTSTRTTLIKILSQVKPEADAWQSTWSCNEIITEIWGFLRTRRYFEWGYFNLN